MAHLIDKDALVAEIERRKQVAFGWMETAPNDAIEAEFELCDDILSFLDTLKVKEVDIDKLCEFRENIGFAYPEGASEYQKQLACYRQGIKDVIKAQKGE